MTGGAVPLPGGGSAGPRPGCSSTYRNVIPSSSHALEMMSGVWVTCLVEVNKAGEDDRSEGRWIGSYYPDGGLAWAACDHSACSSFLT